MNFFRLKEWRRYRRKAHSRHGIHSPFVFRFVEQALRGPLPVLPAAPARSRYRQAQEELRARCCSFLNREHPGLLPCFEWLEGRPESVRLRATQKLPQLRQGLCLLLPDIHDSPARAALWQELCADERVNLSLDIWYFGLLFFKPEFQEKQHFVLRRRG